MSLCDMRMATMDDADQVLYDMPNGKKHLRMRDLIFTDAEAFQTICETIQDNAYDIEAVTFENCFFNDAQAGEILLDLCRCPNIKRTFFGFDVGIRARIYKPAINFYQILTELISDNEFGAEHLHISDKFEWKVFADLNRALETNTKIGEIIFAETPDGHMDEAFDILENVLKTNRTLRKWHCFRQRPSSFLQASLIIDALTRNQNLYDVGDFPATPEAQLYGPTSPEDNPQEESKTVKRYSPTSPSSPCKKMRSD